jgi:DNA-binding CsgD family transcriptional regulator
LGKKYADPTMYPFAYLTNQMRRMLGQFSDDQQPLTVRLSPDMLDRLELRAQLYGQSLEEAAETLLAEALFKQEEAARLERWQTLTDRESEVAGLACLGLSYNEIANALSIESSTIHTHLKHVYAKMDVEGKQHLRALLADWDFSAFEGLAAKK